MNMKCNLMKIITVNLYIDVKSILYSTCHILIILLINNYPGNGK